MSRVGWPSLLSPPMKLAQVARCAPVVALLSLFSAQAAAQQPGTPTSAPPAEDTNAPAHPDAPKTATAGEGAEPPQAAPPKKEEPAPPLTQVPEQRITYDTTLGVRLNPLGLEVLQTVAYRHRLYKSDSLALRDNYFGVAFTPTFNPALFRIGVAIELRPLTILTLQGGVHGVGYLGTFDNVHSLPTASGLWSDTARDEADKRGETYATHGIEAFARATALAKIGPIVVRDDLTFTYSKLKLHDEERLYYHPRWDMLVQNAGWFLHNDSDVVYLTDFGLLAGVRGSLTHAFYSEELLGDGEGDENSPMFRIGPIAAWTIFDEPGASFNKPTIIGFVQWWVLQRFRTGEDVSQAIPYGTIAFRFEGDLWRTD